MPESLDEPGRPSNPTTSRMATTADGAAATAAADGLQVPCQTCGSPQRDFVPGAQSFVYAIGRLEPRFPTLGVEKELAQAIGKAGTAKLTDRGAMHKVLSEPNYLYLVRQLCWVFTIESSDAYVVAPRDTEDIRMLVGALRPAPTSGDIEVVVGWLGPFADGRACNGVRLPTISLAQLYSFDMNSFAGHLPRPTGCSDEAFKAIVEEVLDRARLLSDNLGIRGDHRAINYLVTRDPSLYTEVANYYGKNFSLSAVRVNPSPLSGPRNLTEVVLEFRDRVTDNVEKRFVKVDVTDVFPFKQSKWAAYTER